MRRKCIAGNAAKPKSTDTRQRARSALSREPSPPAHPAPSAAASVAALIAAIGTIARSGERLLQRLPLCLGEKCALGGEHLDAMIEQRVADAAESLSCAADVLRGRLAGIGHLPQFAGGHHAVPL